MVPTPLDWKTFYNCSKWTVKTSFPWGEDEGKEWSNCGTFVFRYTSLSCYARAREQKGAWGAWKVSRFQKTPLPVTIRGCWGPVTRKARVCFWHFSPFWLLCSPDFAGAPPRSHPADRVSPNGAGWCPSLSCGQPRSHSPPGFGPEPGFFRCVLISLKTQAAVIEPPQITMICWEKILCVSGCRRVLFSLKRSWLHSLRAAFLSDGVSLHFSFQLPIIMVVAFSMCIICLLMAGKSALPSQPHAEFGECGTSLYGVLRCRVHLALAGSLLNFVSKASRCD